jgi:hypothetical protein
MCVLRGEVRGDGRGLRRIFLVRLGSFTINIGVLSVLQKLVRTSKMMFKRHRKPTPPKNKNKKQLPSVTKNPTR